MLPYNTQQSGGSQENFCSAFQAPDEEPAMVYVGYEEMKGMLASHSWLSRNFVAAEGCTLVSRR